MSCERTRRRSGESGFTLIDMLFVLMLIALLSTLAIPALMRAKGAAQSASALATIRVINSAQLSFAITCGLGFYSPDLPSLGIKPPSATEAFLPDELSAGPTFIKSGYLFSMAGTSLGTTPATCNGMSAGSTSPAYALVADQLIGPGPTSRFFGTNADGLIFEHTSSLAAVMPENGAPPVGTPLAPR